MKSPDNSAAVRESRLSRIQSAKNASMQMKLMKEQMAAAEGVTPEVIPPPAPPQMASKDVEDAGLDQRRLNKRRFGLGKTTFAGSNAGKTSLGGMAALGGATMAA